MCLFNIFKKYWLRGIPEEYKRTIEFHKAAFEHANWIFDGNWKYEPCYKEYANSEPEPALHIHNFAHDSYYTYRFNKKLGIGYFDFDGCCPPDIYIRVENGKFKFNHHFMGLIWD